MLTAENLNNIFCNSIIFIRKENGIKKIHTKQIFLVGDILAHYKQVHIITDNIFFIEIDMSAQKQSYLAT